MWIHRFKASCDELWWWIKSLCYFFGVCIWVFQFIKFLSKKWNEIRARGWEFWNISFLSCHIFCHGILRSGSIINRVCKLHTVNSLVDHYNIHSHKSKSIVSRPSNHIKWRLTTPTAHLSGGWAYKSPILVHTAEEEVRLVMDKGRDIRMWSLAMGSYNNCCAYVLVKDRLSHHSHQSGRDAFATWVFGFAGE